MNGTTRVLRAVVMLLVLSLVLTGPPPAQSAAASGTRAERIWQNHIEDAEEVLEEETIPEDAEEPPTDQPAPPQDAEPEPPVQEAAPADDQPAADAPRTEAPVDPAADSVPAAEVEAVPGEPDPVAPAGNQSESGEAEEGEADEDPEEPTTRESAEEPPTDQEAPPADDQPAADSPQAEEPGEAAPVDSEDSGPDESDDDSGAAEEGAAIQANTPPEAVDDLVTTHHGVSIQIRLLDNDTDVDGDDLALDSVSGIVGGDVQINSFGSGIVTFNPTAGFVGDGGLTYVVTDGTDTDTGTVTVTVTNTPPTAVDDSVTTHQGIPIQFSLIANDSDPDGDDVDLLGRPTAANGSIATNSFGDGIVTYTPDAGFAGTDTFTYTMTDGADEATATVTVTVTNTPPTAVDDSVTTTEDTPIQIRLLDNDSDLDGDDLDLVGRPAASNGRVSVNSFGNGIVTFTPNAGFVGDGSFSYVVTDGAATDTATVTVTVTAVNSPPVAADDTATTTADTPVEIDVLVNDTDVDGDALSINFAGDGVVTTAPTNGSTNNLTDRVRYTPDSGFVGTDTFTYQITDGQFTAVATVTVTVGTAQGNQPPVANPDAATTTAPEPVTIDVLANDTDPDGDVLQVVFPIGVPANGSSSIDRSDVAGKVVYHPDAGFSGTDTFTYTVSDGETTSIGTVTVTVEPAEGNSPPVAVDDNYTTAQDTALEVALPGVFANDSDPEGDDFGISSAFVVPTAEHGSLTLSSGDGAFLYTPDPGFVGTDSFQYQLTDGQALGNVATVTIEVTAVEPEPTPTSVPTDEETPNPTSTPLATDAEKPAPKQPAAKPTAVAQDQVTALPNAGAGTSRGSDRHLALWLIVVLALAAPALHRRRIERHGDRASGPNSDQA
jgi:hypothetical protein